MNDGSGVTAIVCLALLALIALAMRGCSSVECSNHWKDSGHASRYSAMSGCMVEESPGRWVPEDNYRVLP